MSQVRFNIPGDVDKLILRDEHEKKQELLRNYDLEDDSKFPGFTFLFPEVIETYGICPFLHNGKKSQLERQNWIETRSDRGKIYYQLFERLVDPTRIANLEAIIERNVYDYRTYVCLKLNDIFNLDNSKCSQLFSDIKNYGESVKTKKVKNLWSVTKTVVDNIALESGLDLVMLINLTENVKINHFPQSNQITDVEFIRLTEMLKQSLKNKLNEELFIYKQTELAKSILADLIQKNFQIEQIGRYYKRWGNLSDYQKQDRIKSYADFLTRSENKPIEFSKTIVDFVWNAIQDKTLKSSDIEWNRSDGIVTNINIVVSENAKIEIPKNPAKSVRKRIVNTAKLSKGAESISEKDYKRIHRLLLSEIISTSTPIKNQIVENVLESFHSKLGIQSSVESYINATFDKMVKIIIESQ